jgi:hypothetical protein
MIHQLLAKAAACICVCTLTMDQPPPVKPRPKVKSHVVKKKAVKAKHGVKKRVHRKRHKRRIVKAMPVITCTCYSRDAIGLYNMPAPLLPIMPLIPNLGSVVEENVPINPAYYPIYGGFTPIGGGGGGGGFYPYPPTPTPEPTPTPVPTPVPTPSPTPPVVINPPGPGTPTPIPGVPEPATWAMMILGFGFVGYRLRRRTAHVVVAH